MAKEVPETKDVAFGNDIEVEFKANVDVLEPIVIKPVVPVNRLQFPVLLINILPKEVPDTKDVALGKEIDVEFKANVDVLEPIVIKPVVPVNKLQFPVLFINILAKEVPDTIDTAFGK